SYELLLERIEVLVNDSTSTISVYLFELKLSSNFYAYLNKLSRNYARIIFIQAYAQLVNLHVVLWDSDGACNRVLYHNILALFLGTCLKIDSSVIN
ncbi:MAG: hypothetical protein QN819_10080, partial [Nitrososphaeraceae archaeon]|nr:hypothetical protein [Nitrososphaeraceae archaeon]